MARILCREEACARCYNLRAGVRASALLKLLPNTTTPKDIFSSTTRKGWDEAEQRRGAVCASREFGPPGGMAGNGTERWQAAEEKIKEWKDKEGQAFRRLAGPAPGEKQTSSLLLPYSPLTLTRQATQISECYIRRVELPPRTIGQVTEMRTSTVALIPPSKFRRGCV